MGAALPTTTEPRADGAAAEPGRVLIVDDDPLLLRALARTLRPDGHEVVEARDWAGMREALGAGDVDAVLLDLVLGRESGRMLLARTKAFSPDVEVVMMTGHGSVESAVDCMQGGAFDYLQKPFDDVHRVRTTVRRAVERRRLVARNRELEEELRERGDASELVGTSPAMRRLVRTIAGLRHNESHVLVTGESGTGKELVARAIHAASPRVGRPFVPVDCGALPETIIESELFGHRRGAFTGAVGAPGLFRVADGGTLFLDEVGEIPPSVQAKLLRALQHGEVRPVGAAETVRVDLRVVCATHRDLAAMVEAGQFRRDLFYRLDVVRLAVPPLRERREDVPRLALHFLAKHRRADAGVEGIEPDALERLCRHPWPGNVRELENAVESALALARGPRLRAADFHLGAGSPGEGAGTGGDPARGAGGPDPARGAGGPDPACGAGDPDPARGLPLSLGAYERCALERALREADGDVPGAARRLGIGRSTFYRKLARHGLRAGRRHAG